MPTGKHKNALIVVIKVLGAIELLLLCLNLFAIIYIFIKYILRLKIKGKFVLMFYGISMILTILILIQCVYKLFREDYPKISFHDHN